MDPRVAGSNPVDRPFPRGALNFFQALILGIVQGITEFFPVSSSAHLRFVRSLMGLSEGQQWLYFDLACHLGTWVALVIFLRREIFSVLTDLRQIFLFTLALIPLVPAYFLLKPLRIHLSDPAYTGFFLILTGLLLLFACRAQRSRTGKIPAVVCVGIAQAAALLPGLSRSGSTIAVGRFCGWNWVEAARFSFLLAVPTILGGEVLESMKLDGHVDLGVCAVGFCSAALVGMISVRCVFWLYEKGAVKPVAWYCVAFGLLWLRKNLFL